MVDMAYEDIHLLFYLGYEETVVVFHGAYTTQALARQQAMGCVDAEIKSLQDEIEEEKAFCAPGERTDNLDTLTDKLKWARKLKEDMEAQPEWANLAEGDHGCQGRWKILTSEIDHPRFPLDVT